MELWAAGLNAWGQLRLENNDNQASGDDSEDPEDYYQFTRVLWRKPKIEHVQAFLSHTIVKYARNVERTAGCVPSEHLRLYQNDHEAYRTMAEAANGLVVIRTPSGAMKQFDSLKDLLDGAPGQELPALQDCIQVVAYDAGFAALTSTGTVYTWGDERYIPCLARDIDENSPSDKPGLVHSLQDLPTGPITKIAAGGYILAALTKGNDLYVWGGHLGKRTIPIDLVGGPTPVVIDEHDIEDVAVGDAHLIVLTTENQVFVIGDNRNGQLGIEFERAYTWEEVKLELGDRKVPAAVAAGPRSSFITVKTMPHPFIV